MATLPGASARTVVPGSVKYIKANGFSGFGTVPSATAQPSLKYLNETFAAILDRQLQDRTVQRPHRRRRDPPAGCQHW